MDDLKKLNLQRSLLEARRQLATAADTLATDVTEADADDLELQELHDEIGDAKEATQNAIHVIRFYGEAK